LFSTVNLLKKVFHRAPFHALALTHLYATRLLALCDAVLTKIAPLSELRYEIKLIMFFVGFDMQWTKLGNLDSKLFFAKTLFLLAGKHASFAAGAIVYVYQNSIQRHDFCSFS
jgi:hypothetical protein